MTPCSTLPGDPFRPDTGFFPVMAYQQRARRRIVQRCDEFVSAPASVAGWPEPQAYWTPRARTGGASQSTVGPAGTIPVGFTIGWLV